MSRLGRKRSRCSAPRGAPLSWWDGPLRETRGRSQRSWATTMRRARARRGCCRAPAFIDETVRELGEKRASGFLKKFYGWYLGRGRFPKPFKQELVQLDSLREVERLLLSAAPGASSHRRAPARESERRRGAARASDLGLRRRIGKAGQPPADAPNVQSAWRWSQASAGSSPCSSPTSSARPAIGERLGAERFELLIDEVMRVMSAAGRALRRHRRAVRRRRALRGLRRAGRPRGRLRARRPRGARDPAGARAVRRARCAEAYGVELAVRIAINTGPVVIRPDSDDPYNALGDTVNVAARIQELVAGGEIVVGRVDEAPGRELLRRSRSSADTSCGGSPSPSRPFRVRRRPRQARQRAAGVARSSAATSS